MPTRRVSAKRSSYKSKRGQGVRRTRKSTGILAKAKKARVAKRNAKIVKRYKTARILRQPSLGLPDSQVVRMSFAYTYKHPGFVGEDMSDGHPFPAAELPHHNALYTFMDSNRVGETSSNVGPFGVPMFVIRLNDISKCMQFPTEGGHYKDNKVANFFEYGKFYRDFQVLGADAKVTYRYLYGNQRVDDDQMGTAALPSMSSTPPVLLWATQNSADKDADGTQESLIPGSYQDMIEMGPKLHKMTTKIVKPIDNVGKANTVGKKWSLKVAKRIGATKWRGNYKPTDYTGKFQLDEQPTIIASAFSEDNDYDMLTKRAKSPEKIHYLRVGAMCLTDKPDMTGHESETGGSTVFNPTDPTRAPRMPPSLITIKVDYLVKVSGRKLSVFKNNERDPHPAPP